MEKLETLTKEQEVLIPIVRQEWLDLFFKNKGVIDKPLFEKEIEWLYKRVGFEKPLVWYCDSPMMCQIITNLLKNNIGDNIGANIWANIRANIRDNIGDNIRDNIRANIGDNIGDNIWANIWANIRANIGANIGANIWANIDANIEANIGANIRDNIEANIGANIWANIRANIRANIGDNIDANIGANIGANKLEFLSFTYYGNTSDYGWCAFYDYFRRLDYFKYDWTDFIEFQKLIKSGLYDFIPFKNIVFVSSCPTEIYQDINNRLHNTMKAAVVFKDEYRVYAIHGRILPSWIWEEKDKITKEQFLKEQNAEIRAGIYTVLGEKRMMKLLEAEETDKQLIQHDNDEIEIIKLYKTKEVLSEINNKLAWVKFICPSTGTDYLIACEPKYDNAKEAAASLSIFSTNDYSFNFRT